jgi:ubiquinone/menaquinone biosynthesis C-methylase UbiE
MNLSTVSKKLFAWGMAKANQADGNKIKIIGYQDHSNLAQLKQTLLGNIQGKVLEIGPGAGVNLSYYPKNVDWLGIEPNIFMFPYLEQEAQKQGLAKFALKQGCAEKIPVESNSINVIVSTHVLCSVKDIKSSLEEIYRVLKPQGSFIFLEHIAAESGTITRCIQNGVNPGWQILFDNCHPNQETLLFLEDAGFETLRYQKFSLSFPIVSPHIAGIASKKNCLNNS